ncbi:hypothetical protein [Mangrovicoccus sp. HB161399]|uniref:hypothetical protein n=1 Tax=Mangrovicoccus sp. HB161399 TaxID=2720392 RepID=UPI0015577A06|nr:hypothetical protein [Mangrovicoccus sp. HB161399]
MTGVEGGSGRKARRFPEHEPEARHVFRPAVLPEQIAHGSEQELSTLSSPTETGGKRRISYIARHWHEAASSTADHQNLIEMELRRERLRKIEIQYDEVAGFDIGNNPQASSFHVDHASSVLRIIPGNKAPGEFALCAPHLLNRMYPAGRWELEEATEGIARHQEASDVDECRAAEEGRSMHFVFTSLWQAGGLYNSRCTTYGTDTNVYNPFGCGRDHFSAQHYSTSMDEIITTC